MHISLVEWNHVIYQLLCSSLRQKLVYGHDTQVPHADCPIEYRHIFEEISLWMIHASVFFQYSLVLIPKRKRQLGAGRIRCGACVTPATICLYTTSTGIDADASKGKTRPGYLDSKLVWWYYYGIHAPHQYCLSQLLQQCYVYFRRKSGYKWPSLKIMSRWHGIPSTEIIQGKSCVHPCKHQQSDCGPLLAYYLRHILIFALYRYDSNKCLQKLSTSHEIKHCDIVVQCTIPGGHIM